MADEIHMRFPGTPEYVRLARLAAADVGSRAEFDIDAIDDLRMAISELCGIVTGDGTRTTTLEFTITDGRVEVMGAGGAVDPTERAEFAEALVAAVADEYELSTDGDVATFRLVKRAGTVPTESGG